MTTLTLILGGARSGKSRRAEALVTALPPPWTYIATAEAFDAEMEARIAAHRARRAAGWQTQNAPRDLPSVLSRATAPVLVDCLTLWLSNLMLAEADIAAATDALEAALVDVELPDEAVTALEGLRVGAQALDDIVPDVIPE